MSNKHIYVVQAEYLDHKLTPRKETFYLEGGSVTEALNRWKSYMAANRFTIQTYMLNVVDLI